MASILGLMLAALLLVPVYIVHGYVLHLLWGWFMVPALHVPQLDVGYAIGVSLTLSMFVSDTPVAPEGEKARRAHLIKVVGDAPGDGARDRRHPARNPRRLAS